MSNWKSTDKLIMVMETFKALINAPSTDEATFNQEVSEIFTKDHDKFLHNAKEWVKKYASGK
jgi:ubiquitin-protein ligase